MRTQTRAALGLLLLSSTANLGITAAHGETVPQAERGSPFSAEMSATVGFDDTVFIEEIDTGASSGDAFLGTEVDVDWRIAGKAGGPNLEIGYGYGRTDYEDVTEFDIQSHQVSGTGRAKIGKADLSLAYNYRHIRLAGDGLLDIHLLTPTISGLVTHQLVGVLTYSRTRKVFATLPERNATGHQISATLIKLLDLKGSYVFAGGSIGKERARTAEFHNNSVRLDSSVSKKTAFGIQHMEISAGASFECRNYTGFNPIVQGLRKDREYDFSTKAKYNLNDRLSAQLSWERSITKSNLVFARYSGNTFELRLLWEL